MALRRVPVIDIAPFLAGSPEGKRRVANEVGSACEEIGFLIVKGHGVPRDLVEEMYDVSKRFFALPLDEKMRARGRDRILEGPRHPGAQLALTLQRNA